MPKKSSKSNNDLRAIRIETAAFLFAGALVSLLTFTLILSFTSLPPLFCGLALITFYIVYCVLIWQFVEKRRRGMRDETLAPVMGRIMFDAVVKMSSPVFICDQEERILWYNNATEAVVSAQSKLYGQLISDIFGVTLADIRSNRSEKGARITCEGRSFVAKYKTAVGAGFHLHIGAHPSHRAALGDHAFTGIQVTDNNRQSAALKIVFHRYPPLNSIIFLTLRYQSIC